MNGRLKLVYALRS